MGDHRHDNPIKQPPTWVPLYELSSGVEALEHRIVHGGSQNHRQTNDTEVADVLDECVLIRALMTPLHCSLALAYYLRIQKAPWPHAFAFQDASQDTTDSSKLNVQ